MRRIEAVHGRGGWNGEERCKDGPMWRTEEQVRRVRRKRIGGSNVQVQVYVLYIEHADRLHCRTATVVIEQQVRNQTSVLLEYFFLPFQ